VSSNLGDELVTSSGLGNGDSTLVKEFLQVRFGPALIEPVARIVSSLSNLLGYRVVVLTNSG